MKLIKILMYLMVYLLISLGDGLLKLAIFLTSPVIYIFRNKIFEAYIEKQLKRLKKKETILYKSPKNQVKNKKEFQKLLRLFLTYVLRSIKNTGFAAKAISLIIINSSTYFGQNVWLIFVKTGKLLIFIISYPVFIFKTISYKRKTIPKKKPKSIRSTIFLKFRYFILGGTASFIFGFLPLLGFIMLYDLPNPSVLSTNYIPKTTKIYDRNDVLLYEIYANQNRTLVRLSEVPHDLINATIAIEDKDFYVHPGFDLRGILRAFISNVQGKELQGGSTITQQLIKSALLTPTPNILRKIKEVALAFWAERMYSKDQILELYFNYVSYGGTAWGVEAASDVYFKKSVSDLNLAESAYLAGLPRAPSIYSPYSSESKIWKKRQKEVLDAMERTGFINKEESKKAYDEELIFQSPVTPIKAPHFVMYIKELLVRQFGLSEVERGGLVVKTSLDLSTQEQVEEIVAEEVENNSYLNIQNGAALVINPKNGDILAMVGSKNYFDQEIDGNVNITTSKRQPGSTIKVVTYALALTTGYTEASVIDDSPLSIPDGDKIYTPVNYDGKFHGKLPLRLAFANSLNIPAVRIAQKLGVDSIVKFGKEMGVSSWSDSSKYGLSITLGGGEVTMLDLAQAYGTIANEGTKTNINPITRIEDYSGRVIFTKDLQEEIVVDKSISFILSDILADNRARSMEFGLSSPLYIPNHRVSVKTGTTDNKRDNWTVGYNSDYLVVSWVGNNNNTPMSQNLTSGITGAAPIWNKIISMLLKDYNDPQLIIPDSLVKRFCYGFEMYFIKGTENIAPCNLATPSNFPTVSVTPLATPTLQQIIIQQNKKNIRGRRLN